MHYFIVTGASRGIGEALVRELMVPGNVIFCVSRSANESLIADSQAKGIELSWILADLTRTESIPRFMSEIVSTVDTEAAESINLISNAATASPIGRVGSLTVESVHRSLTLNLVSPVLLTELFVKAFGGLAIPLTVIQISSGAASRALPGLSAYSTAKAGLNMYTRSAAADFADKESPVRFVAVSPGPVDTEMQAELRSSDRTNLPDLDSYIDSYENGGLAEPYEAARRVLSVIRRVDIENGAFVHVRDLGEVEDE